MGAAPDNLRKRVHLTRYTNHKKSFYSVGFFPRKSPLKKNYLTLSMLYVTDD